MREPTFLRVRYQKKCGGTWHDAPNGATEVIICNTSMTEDQADPNKAMAIIGYGPHDRASDGFRYRIIVPATALYTIAPGLAADGDEPDDDDGDQSDHICDCGDPDCSQPAGHHVDEPDGKVTQCTMMADLDTGQETKITTIHKETE